MSNVSMTSDWHSPADPEAKTRFLDTLVRRGDPLGTNSRVNPTPRNGIPSARQGFRLYQGVKGVITLYMVGHDPP